MDRLFSEDGTLKKIAITGGAALTLCKADVPYGVSWDGDHIVFGQGNKGVMRVSANGGGPELVVRVNASETASGPQTLDGGRALLFTLATGAGAERWDTAQIVVQVLSSGERKVVLRGGSDARYLPTGHLVYALGGTLLAVPFDVKKLEVRGGPTQSSKVSGDRRFLHSCLPIRSSRSHPLAMGTQKSM